MEKKIQFFKNCPACGKELSGQENICPYCGFDGLHTVFLSHEDYLNWQETVLNPYKDTIQPPRIFAGHPGVLILMHNGDLYGYGNNDSGAFGESNYGLILAKAQLVAQNVKSAALGYNFSIYLTKDGKVKLLGKRSGIPFQERLQDIPDAEEVYAFGKDDIFWVKYKDGKLGVWGSNRSFRIAEQTRVPLKTYDWKVREYDCCATWKRRIESTSHNGYSTVIDTRNYSWTEPNIQKIEREIQETDEFRMYAEKYSAENIFFSMYNHKYTSDRVNTITTSVDCTCDTSSRDAVYKVNMYFENDYVYHPVPVPEDLYYMPGFVQSGSGLSECDALDRRGLLTGKKIQLIYMGDAFILRLLEDGTLEVVLIENGNIYATYQNIADVSASSSHVYIVTKDRKLGRIKTDDFIYRNNLKDLEFIDY